MLCQSHPGWMPDGRTPRLVHQLFLLLSSFPLEEREGERAWSTPLVCKYHSLRAQASASSLPGTLLPASLSPLDLNRLLVTISFFPRPSRHHTMSHIVQGYTKSTCFAIRSTYRGYFAPCHFHVSTISIPIKLLAHLH